MPRVESNVKEQITDLVDKDNLKEAIDLLKDFLSSLDIFFLQFKLMVLEFSDLDMDLEQQEGRKKLRKNLQDIAESINDNKNTRYEISFGDEK